MEASAWLLTATLSAHVAALCLALAATPAQADTTGRATVIDGDTIEIRGERIRLR